MGDVRRKIVAVVVSHWDENGHHTLHIADPDGSVAVVTVDERCPDDRVFEHTHRESPADVMALAPRPWGHAKDDKHERAITRFLRHRDGLRVVREPETPNA